MKLPNFKTNQWGGEEITLTITDITKEEQVNSWKEQVRKLLNGDGLDLLINNAGVLTPGPMEVLSLSAVRREFEVNVFGTGCDPFSCPYYVRQKGALFDLINYRTFSVPFSGPSSASKAAMEAFADVYRTELKPFGIDFIMVSLARCSQVVRRRLPVN